MSYSVTVWNNGTWKVWKDADANQARNDEGWLCELPVSEVIGSLFDVAKDAFATSGKELIEACDELIAAETNLDESCIMPQGIDVAEWQQRTRAAQTRYDEALMRYEIAKARVRLEAGCG